MTNAKRELTSVLKERGVQGEALVAAWSGQLSLPADIETNEHPVAILGVSRDTGYLLSRSGLQSFELANITTAQAQGRDELTVVAANKLDRLTIKMIVDMPVAIATQLLEMRDVASRSDVDVPRRTKAKSRRPTASQY